MRVSKAAVTLRARLTPATPPVMNQTKLAKELGVSQQAVNAWLKGRALPEPERMAAIESLLQIPMRDWVEVADDDTSDPDESGESPTVTHDAADALVGPVKARESSRAVDADAKPTGTG